MILVHGIRLPLDAPWQQAVAPALKKARLREGDVGQALLHRASVDARHQRVGMVYSIALELKDPALEAACATGPDVQRTAGEAAAPPPGSQPLLGPVVVCGLGPAGLFCALRLARAGFAPLVLERGGDMDARRAAVDAFEAGGALDENNNIQFGEGGAGTFSDGKLTTRIKDPLCGTVLQALLAAGAPDEIAYRAKPHIGTDLLRGVFVTLRQQLVQLGGRVLFNTRLTGLVAKNGRLCAVRTTAGQQPCGALVLAAGHSARDTFEAAGAAGVPLLAKPFSVGFRIEQLQKEIDEGLYHEAAGHPALPPGEYQLSTKVGGRGVYTFCMCPGGSVVAAASQAGGVVTNGMSLHARGGANANAALVASVGEADFGPGPFGGIAFQRGLEQAAYEAGGGSYAAPAQTAHSFLQGGAGLGQGPVRPSYPRGVRAADLGALLPPGVAAALRGGLVAFGRRLPGFAPPYAVLTGLETRTSSPVRMPRGESLESTGLAGLYPCGEGAGYAGGIMSAAVDGLRVADAIIARYAPNNTIN